MIGIVGTGVMAKGIALQAAVCGHAVTLVGRQADSAETCRLAIAGQLAALAEKRHLTSAPEGFRARADLAATTDYAALAACDAVIEAVVERLDVKQAVLRESERHVPASCLLLTCTSSIGIASLATGLGSPGRFLGMHFFNPAHVMPLVEVVPHGGTSADSVARAQALGASLGKRTLLVKDTPGFFVNRVLFAYIEGFCTVLGEVGDYRWIDEVMVRNGWPVGPAGLLDAVGIDTCVDIGRILVRAYPDTFSAAFAPVLEPLVRHGWTGRKCGAGFYRYPDPEHVAPGHEANREALALPGGVARRAVTEQEVVERLMLPVTNEVFRCIEEGVISTPDEADQAIFLSMGYGRRGGVCRQLKRTGIESHLAKCAQYASLGAIYHPPAALLGLAR